MFNTSGYKMLLRLKKISLIFLHITALEAVVKNINRYDALEFFNKKVIEADDIHESEEPEEIENLQEPEEIEKVEKIRKPRNQAKNTKIYFKKIIKLCL